MFYVFSPRLTSLIKDLDIVDCLAPHTVISENQRKDESVEKNNSNNYKAFYDKFARLCENNKIKCYLSAFTTSERKTWWGKTVELFHKLCPCLHANRDILLNHATNNHFLFFLRIFFFFLAIPLITSEITYVSCGSLWLHPALQKHLSAK